MLNQFQATLIGKGVTLDTPTSAPDVDDKVPSWNTDGTFAGWIEAGGGGVTDHGAALARVVAVANIAMSAWDISTGSYASKSLSVNAQEPAARDIAFSADGTKVYVVGSSTDTIYQYTLSTAWDVSTGSYATKSLSVAAQSTTPSGLAFSSDGTKAYFL
jgi:hypothetical protein